MRKKRFIWPASSGLLQTLSGARRRAVTGSPSPGIEESEGKPQMVDEGPTKHWTTTVIMAGEVSVECRCGWLQVMEVRPEVMGLDTGAALDNRVGIAVRLGRKHVSKQIPEIG